MTQEEKKELSKIICGSSLCGDNCWSYRDPQVDYLVYDGTMFRCASRDYCNRVTPKTGKLQRHIVGGRRTKRVDELKQGIIHRKIKLLKETPDLVTMKLMSSDNKIWIDINGKRVNPKRFNRSWYLFRWEWGF